MKPSYSASTSYGSSSLKKIDAKGCDQQKVTTSAGEKKTSQWQFSHGSAAVRVEPGLAKYGTTAANCSASEPPGNYDAESTAGSLQLSGLFSCNMYCSEMTQVFGNN